MRKDFGAKTWLYPMPVLILGAYGANGEPMAMNAAWGGIGAENTVVMCIDSGHKTTEYILQSKGFTISPATADQLTACDYVGIVSGNKVPDKMERSGFHTHKAQHVNAPIIEELPLALECELVSYDTETELMIGRIVNVSADDSILGDDGKIDADKAQFLSFDPVTNSYRTLGPVAGRAFHAGLALSQK